MTQPTSKEMFRERPIVSTPSLTATLKSLEPGDYVHCGHQWSRSTIREVASKLEISIQTKLSDKGITVRRSLRWLSC